jgi:hyperosmotically inducible periplasmic protein
MRPMARLFLFSAIFSLAAACGEPPAPKPAPKAEPAPPAVQPAPKPAAQAPEPVKPDPNRELAQRVKRALEDEAKIQAAGIDVTAADGKVTLWGTAATSAERTRAAQVAGKVEGVTAVENKLAVVKGS